MKKVAVLSGAGISAESGLATFRDAGGLWDGYDVMDVASIEGWHRDPELVLSFYNQRREQAKAAGPNNGHKILAEIQKDFDVTIITQNVDDLHEKAGSQKVIHLHGELFKARSTADPALVTTLSGDTIHLGDLCFKGSQLRPHIVWFGEEVPLMEKAIQIVEQSDILIVVGTSLQVYPAAGLVHYARAIPIFVVDINIPPVNLGKNVVFIEAPATIGMQEVKDILYHSEN